MCFTLENETEKKNKRNNECDVNQLSLASNMWREKDFIVFYVQLEYT